MRISLQTKLLTGFLALVVILMITSGVGLLKMAEVSAGLNDVTERWMPKVSGLEQMSIKESDLQAVLSIHVLEREATKKAMAEDTLNTLIAEIEDQQKAYEPLITTDDERKMFDEYPSETFSQMAEQLHALIQRFKI